MNALTPFGIQQTIEETKTLLGSVRQSMIKVAQNLYFLRSTGEHEKFGAWAEEEFGISQSMTSKLANAYEGWVIQAGVPVERLEGIDYEKLYGYLPLLKDKEPEQALAEVTTWSRKDIKDEKSEKTPCFHPLIKKCCMECWEVIPDNGD